MKDRQHILVIRFSAMGDVALATPVLRSVDTGTDKILVLTRPAFKTFFENLENLDVYTADLGGRHKGLRGLIRLFRDINRDHNIKLVIDLHSVMRSWLTGFLYSIKGVKVYRIDKGRKEKRDLLKGKLKKYLPHTTDRYRNVFARAGYKLGGLIIPSFIPGEAAEEEARELISKKVPASAALIGVSPFARHKAKMWDIRKMKKLMGLLTEHKQVFFILFGGRDELGGLEQLAAGFDNSLVAAGRYRLDTELAIISKTDLMISMDSANMHLAVLSGVATVSIWGGTHPMAGFAPAGDQGHLIVQTPTEDLDCRPCTVYGKGKCIRRDVKYKCMEGISPEMVYSKMTGFMP